MKDPLVAPTISEVEEILAESNESIEPYSTLKLVHVGLLFFVLVAIACWAGSNSYGLLTDTPLSGDSLAYVELAHNLTEGNGFALEGKPYYRRDLGYPAFIALTHAADLRRVTFDCVRDSPECASIRSSMKIGNIWLTSVLVVATGLTALLISGSVLAGLAAALVMAASSWWQWFAIDQPNSEPLAALLVLVHSAALSCMFQVSSQRKRAVAGAVSGLALGLLVLTKAVFLYWLYLLLMVGAVVLLRMPVLRKATAVALLIPVVIAGGWMLRNAHYFGDFAVAGRDGEVLTIRAAFLEMTWSEFRAGFFAFGPDYPRWVVGSLPRPADSDVARFDRSNPVGFYQTGKRETREAELKGSVGDLRASGMDRIAAEPLKYAAHTVLFAWRAAFPTIFRYRQGPSHDPSFTVAAWVRLAGMGSLLFLALYSVVRKRWDMIVFVLPALFSWGIHAAATHAIPRYSAPIVPVMIVGVALVGCLMVVWLIRDLKINFTKKVV